MSETAPAGLDAPRPGAEADATAPGATTGLAGMVPPDFPAKAADIVDNVVSTIHDKALRPLTLAARAIVFGLVVAALGTLMAILLAIGALRILDVYAFPGRVWLSYVVLGGLFTLGGLAVWSQRTARHPAGSD